MRLRMLAGGAIALIAALLAIDATAYRGHYRKAAWHEFQLRTGLLHKRKIDHKKRTAAGHDWRSRDARLASSISPRAMTGGTDRTVAH